MAPDLSCDYYEYIQGRHIRGREKKRAKIKHRKKWDEKKQVAVGGGAGS